MATCSSSTMACSVGLVGANNHDLANFSTMRHRPPRSLRPGPGCSLRALLRPASRTASYLGTYRQQATLVPRQRLSGLQIVDVGQTPQLLCPLMMDHRSSRGFKDPTIGFLLGGANDGTCKKQKSVSSFNSEKDIRRNSWRCPNLLGLHLHPLAPLFFVNPLGPSSDLLCRGVSKLNGR
ncbi:LOW QUALITY PROTEIN: hypothetical protein Cgig2_029439 [Carnegiea gigantea]|uniref:Uncharacterized protein n=1 Tax=Carnegiea gigantea TaxID=171969 RepID=A0A9Q1Q942_9CARY|nr:LOW QUALITY PROTEIN: hypothetical protein Cgig2_029439 [Carnegiea gigantea]